MGDVIPSHASLPIAVVREVVARETLYPCSRCGAGQTFDNVSAHYYYSCPAKRWRAA